jgi:uncharacterized protein YbaP (TraB family)
MLTFVLSLALILADASPSHKPQHRAMPPFYRIVSHDLRDTSYLFGTLHLLESSYVDTMPSVMAALNRSDEVVGELVLDSAATGDIMQSFMSGPPLDSLLTKAQYKRVSAAVKSYAPAPMMFLNNVEPIILYTIILEGMYAKAHPENQMTHVEMDMFFEDEAKKAGKPIIGLESADDQLGVIDSVPISEQVADLMELVSNAKTASRQMDKMLADYSAGRISKILDDPSFGSFTPEEMGSLIYDRNKKWLDTLPKLLADHKLFIAVGAGHLPGEHGLVDGLKKSGFFVTKQNPYW